MKANQKENKYFTVVTNVVAVPCILKDTGDLKYQFIFQR